MIIHVQEGVFAYVLVLSTAYPASLFGFHLIDAYLMRSGGHVARGYSLCNKCQTNSFKAEKLEPIHLS